MSQKGEKKWIRFTVQISLDQYYEIRNVMQRLGYKTVAEFVRDAIREKLERDMGSR